MWKTVELITMVDGYEVPQFNGKWPFTRIFGLQEPVAVLASLLNLAANVYMINKLCKTVRIYENRNQSCKFKKLWYFMSLVSVAVWLFSFLYHAKEV